VSSEGHMRRPAFSILGDDALVPDSNLIRPPPNRFSHELVVDEPYRFDRAEPAPEPDGVFSAGTLVLLVVDGPERCRVADGRGVVVEVRRSSLRELGDA
jgi:hypothetical protein